jgi:tetratricopeptide (TPR) repeat protein
VTVEGGTNQVLDLETGAVRRELGTHPAGEVRALSGDGRWAASCGWHSDQVWLWDLGTGETVHKWVVGKQTYVYFTPDSRALIISRGDEFSFWDVQTFQRILRLPRDLTPYPGWVAFSADGGLMALEMAPGVVHLKEAAGGRTVARLEDPHGDRAYWLGFTPDGTRLVVTSHYANAVHVWDLRAIRMRLKEMNLDWDWPEFPPAAAAAPNGASAGLYDLGPTLVGQQKLKAGNALWQQGKLDEALAAYQEAIRLQPDNAWLYATLGTAYGQLSQWDKAATHTGKAIALRPSQDLWWQYHTAFLLRAGDTTGYRDACQRMLERFRQKRSPWSAHRVALNCLLIPDAVGDQEALMDLAKWAESAAPEDYWYVITLGMACYRAGQFEEAARRLRQALKKWPENPYDSADTAEEGAPVMAWLIQAMAHHRLDQGEEARLWLSKAVQKMDQELAEKGAGHLRKQTHVWAMCQVLRTEAEALLKTADTVPAKPKGN